ncbi:DUF262 domain-containing protein [Mycobacterium sp. E1747]|uniref:GmrSD restriction endonuclease domain-containing protein n=1 Tax=Mycobacterium sp. E1747 TaxID=1834128 RepID=UPI0008010F33|nr:DUF262 domain-containing protein [Mycobacterium sp. E1747]OBH10059.1 hypothetical protein A5695_22685 [Mycobacterium sp. E1747]
MTEPKEATSRSVRDPKPTADRIHQLAGRVLSGDIVLPEFQRPFVWKRHQILELLDSIYRNYPIGSMLVWESSLKLMSKRSIADLQIAERSPNYPVNYLLDGQQRLSTVCGVLHWKPGKPTSVWNVAFDLKTRGFFHVDTLEELPLHQIPLRRLADPSEFYRKISPLTDPHLSAEADLLFNRFTDYQVPLVTLGEMELHDVAPVFERINSTGTRLTIFDLMRAATWSTNFDLGRSVDEIRNAIAPKRFAQLDEKVFLRALSAAAGGSFTAESIDDLRKRDDETLKKAVEATIASALLACDFLSTEVDVPRYEALPYANQFVVLCEIFRRVPQPNGAQLTEIRNWFWRTTLAGYFGGWNGGQMASDIVAIRRWVGNETQTIEIGTVTSNERLWRTKSFRSNSATSKMVALMLAQAQPRDILNGQKIDPDKSLAWSNDKEFHHFFPQAYLRNQGVSTTQANLVANIVMLSSASNIQIKDASPQEYLTKIINQDGREEIVKRLATCLVSEAALDAALQNDYESFLQQRSITLQEHALDLCGESEDQSAEAAIDPDEIEDSDDDSSD